MVIIFDNLLLYKERALIEYMQKTIKTLKELEKYPVFDLNILKGIMGKDSAYAKVYLSRLKKAGLVFEIERNKHTAHKNAFLIASRILWPSYISLWSALRFYNLTEQIPHAVSVVTTRNRKKSIIDFFGIKIIFNHIDKKYFFGFKKVNYDGAEIFIAEPEKAIIDSLLLGKISESEIFEIIKKNKREIDFRDLRRFSVETGDSDLIKAVEKILKKAGGKNYI